MNSSPRSHTDAACNINRACFLHLVLLSLPHSSLEYVLGKDGLGVSKDDWISLDERFHQASVAVTIVFCHDVETQRRNGNPQLGNNWIYSANNSDKWHGTFGLNVLGENLSTASFC